MNNCFRFPSDLIKARNRIIAELASPSQLPTGATRRSGGDCGVVGVGISRGEDPTQYDGYGITVYLANESVARMLQPEYEGKGVRLRVVGEAHAGVWDQDDSSILPAAAVEVSIGHYRGTTGTLGCLVCRRGLGQDDGPFILSCSHVLALSGNGSERDEVIHPGFHDGRIKEPKTVAYLESWAPLTLKAKANRMDAAIARLDPDRLSVDTVTRALGPVQMRGVVDLGTLKGGGVGEIVTKVGRTTGFTRGVVESVRMYAEIHYPGCGKERTGFREQIMVSPLTEDAFDPPSMARFASQGDSGATVLDSRGRVVGILIGTLEHSGRAIVTPITPILDELGVDLYY